MHTIKKCGGHPEVLNMYSPFPSLRGNHQGDMSSWWSLAVIMVVSYQGDSSYHGCLLSGWSLVVIRVVSYQGDSSSWLSVIRVVSHQGGLSSS